jgi:tetratricopeptide (TPR) repeat protein
MGKIKKDYDYDWAGADACYQRALALEPGNAEVLVGAGRIAGILNHFDDALRLDRRAIELDPVHAKAYHELAFHAWWAGRLDEAEAAIHKELKLDQQYPWLHMLLSLVYVAQSRPQEALAQAELESAPAYRLQALAVAYYALGRKEESDRALAELIATHQSNGAYVIAEAYAFRGEADPAFRWLERAYQQREEPVTEMKGAPTWKKLEHDPRYVAFLRKMRLL